MRGRKALYDTAMSGAEREAKRKSLANVVPRRKCADPARRARLEGDTPAWLRWYLPAAFSREFDAPHLEIIRGAEYACANGTRFAVAAERGIGKSVVLNGLTLKLCLSGQQPFPVCLPWAASALKRAFRFWKIALCNSERLDADYPEFTAPFQATKGVAQKLVHATWDDNGKNTGARLQIGDGLIVMPDNLGAIGGSTINGNPRGINLTLDDGRVIRPTMALVDDPQDRETAKSATQAAEIIAVIDGDVAGLGAAGADFPVLLSGNCIQPDDVMAHYLASDEWESLRVPSIAEWPEGFEDAKSETRRLWDEWYDALRDDPEKGVAYYAEHRAEMVKGLRLTAPNAVKVSATTPDAEYHAMRQYYKMGHAAFWAERQQEPIKEGAAAGPYALTPEVICSRVTEAAPGARPEWATTILASTDINPSYALSTVVLAFSGDPRAAVVWYGTYTGQPLPVMPDDTPAERARRVYEALVTHGKELAGLGECRPESWYIDASGTDFDAVLRFAGESARLTGIPAMGCTGRGAKNYRPYGRSVDGAPREQCHRAIDQATRPPRKWLVWHADYWRETAQRAWLGSIGAPGSVALFRGRHVEFAAQVCGEKLMGKAEVGGLMMWNWHTQPGRHDFGDCMAQAYAAAAWGGIGTGGQVVRPRPIRVVRNRAPLRVGSVPLDESLL
jgi:hypothetical protein